MAGTVPQERAQGAWSDAELRDTGLGPQSHDYATLGTELRRTSDIDRIHEGTPPLNCSGQELATHIWHDGPGHAYFGTIAGGSGQIVIDGAEFGYDRHTLQTLDA